MALVKIARAGRDKNKHALWVFKCSCGRDITLRQDHAQRLDSCGDCLPVLYPATLDVSAAVPTLSSVTAAPPASPEPALACPEPIEEAPGPEQGTTEWYRAEIASKQKTIAKLERQESDYGLIMQVDGIQPGDGVTETPDKIWARIVTAIGKFRKELARLKKELARLEAAKAVPTDPRDLYRSKNDAIRAAQQGAKS